MRLAEISRKKPTSGNQEQLTTQVTFGNPTEAWVRG